MLSRVDENFCFDQTGKSYGCSPHLWTNQNNINQIFTIIKNLDETYCIKNTYSENFVGMENVEGEWKFVMRKKGENFQKFKFINIRRNYFMIQNEKGKFFDITGNKADDGVVIQPNDENNSLGQQWKIEAKCT